MLLQIYKGKDFFCGHNIFPEGVFVTQPHNAEI